MSTTDDVKNCPTCGGGGTVLAVERLGVRTFYCTDCEYDWEEQDAEESAAPEAPGPQ